MALLSDKEKSEVRGVGVGGASIQRTKPYNVAKLEFFDGKPSFIPRFRFDVQNYWILLFKDSFSSQPTKELKKHLEHNEQTNQNHQEDNQHKNLKHSISPRMTKNLHSPICILTCVTTLDPFPDERSWKSFRLAPNCSRQSIKASQTLETAHSSATGNW